MILLNVIGKDIKHGTNRSYAIQPEVQLLIALRFYATGAFQVSFSNLFVYEPYIY